MNKFIYFCWFTFVIILYFEAFKFIKLYGIVLDEYYPKYSNLISSIGKCQYKSNLNASDTNINYRGSINGNKYKDYVGLVKQIIRIPKGDDDALIQALHKYGPIAVAISTSSSISAYNNIIHEYGSGIFAQNEGDCLNEKDKLDHSVLLVGYGVTSKGKKYWQVR